MSTQTMNRAQRRMAKRQANRRPNRSAAIYTTNFQLEFESFDSIERLFLSVRNGELEWTPEGWQMMSLSGDPLNIVSALEGWIKYWQALAEDQHLPYDDAAMVKFCKSLAYEKPMQLAEVEAAYAVVCEQRRLYRALPKSVTTRVSHKVQAEIAVENEIERLMKGAA